MFCARFNVAVTITINVSTVGSLALTPTLDTVLLGPCVSRGKGRVGGFSTEFEGGFGAKFATIISGCGGKIGFFVGEA